MSKNKFSKKTLIITGIFLFFFMLLMIYSLKQDPNFTPSQLVGRNAPNFSANIAQGGNFNSLNTFNKGRWVIVNFWSSVCIICRREAPELEFFYKTVTLANINYPDFISINIQDNKETILQWQTNYQQTFPVIQDIDGLISIRYGVTGTPETFFIDPKSTVRFRVAGTLNKNIILDFITWLENNPNANQNDATKALINLRNNS